MGSAFCPPTWPETSRSTVWKGGTTETPLPSFSGRELQVAHLVIRCRRVSVIARAPSLSPKTVNSYRYRIFEKLAIDSDVQLTLLALEHGLVSRRSLKTESEAEAEAIVGD